MNNRYCIIMAGGIGSRFWPLSKNNYPKQFLDILGTGKSFIRSTFERFLPVVPAENFLVVTNAAYKQLVLEHLPELKPDQVLCEPMRRNTAPCIAYANYRILSRCPEASIVVTPADHLVTNEVEFQRVIRVGMDFVEESAHADALLTIGIKPSRPETGYGYIQIDDGHVEAPGIYTVKSFTEKPDATFAQMFIDEGDFLWNAGLDFFNVNVMLSNLYRLVPEYQVEIPRMMAEAESSVPTLVPEFFSSLPNLNIDISIMERSENVCVQEGHFGWADMGTWASLFVDAPSDAQGNVLLNTPAFLYDCQNNVIRLPNGRTAVVKGLQDYVIAEEGEILMICPRGDVTSMRRMHIDTKFS